MISRSRSATDGRLEETSMGGLFIDTNRKCVTLGASITLLSPTPSLDFFLPEGYDPQYDTRHERNGRENHVRVQRKNSDEGKQKHDDD